MSTTRVELIDFAEAPARFMEPRPGRTLVVDDRLAFAHDFGQTWAAVEGVRLLDGDVGDAVRDVAALVDGTSAQRCSWWLTEHSTPVDLEEQLLAHGLLRHDEDYLHAAMLLTREPPAVEGVEVRRVKTLEEHVVARRLALDTFDNPHQVHPTDEQLAAEWELGEEPAWIAYVDGRPASVGRAIYTRVGAYLIGGSTAEWARGRGAYRAVVRARWDEAVRRGTPALAVGAGPMSRPILERLGFEQVLQLRRLESVRSDLRESSSNS